MPFTGKLEQPLYFFMVQGLFHYIISAIMRSDSIIIRGAKEHNLKGFDLTLPRNQFIVVTGLSGSGKSSLAFDTIYAEGQRRYVESLSAYARQFLDQMQKPLVDHIEGLSPTISIEQKTVSRNPRSTVATQTEIYDYLRLLFARVGTPHCPSCGKTIESQSSPQIVDAILLYPQGTKINILAVGCGVMVLVASVDASARSPSRCMSSSPENARGKSFSMN